MNIIEHIEKFLGKISQGWKDKSVDGDLQVVCFRGSPYESVDTLLTLGMSDHVLNISDKKKVRQELVFPVLNVALHTLIVQCLLFICDFMLSDHDALLRGQVIRLPEGLAGKLGFFAMYCTMPVFLDDNFATFKCSDPPTVMVWVIPIYKTEADFIAAYGWNKFEDILEEQAPDLFSLERKQLI